MISQIKLAQGLLEEAIATAPTEIWYKLTEINIILLQAIVDHNKKTYDNTSKVFDRNEKLSVNMVSLAEQFFDKTKTA